MRRGVYLGAHLAQRSEIVQFASLFKKRRQRDSILFLQSAYEMKRADSVRPDEADTAIAN